jgi:hypothetical protein
LVTFFVQAKKVTRSPEGRVEALAPKHQKIKSKVTGFPLRAWGNDEREKQRKLDSRLRGNNEPK